MDALGSLRMPCVTLVLLFCSATSCKQPQFNRCMLTMNQQLLLIIFTRPRWSLRHRLGIKSTDINVVGARSKAAILKRQFVQDNIKLCNVSKATWGRGGLVGWLSSSSNKSVVQFAWPVLLNARLALISVNYHKNIILDFVILLNQWLALTMLHATNPWCATCTKQGSGSQLSTEINNYSGPIIID